MTSPPIVQAPTPSDDDACPVHRTPTADCRDLHKSGGRWGRFVISASNVLDGLDFILARLLRVLPKVCGVALWVLVILMLIGLGPSPESFTLTVDQVHVPPHVSGTVMVIGAALPRLISWMRAKR